MSMKVRSMFALWLALVFGICRADVPTPEQECRMRNAAICEFPASGVQSHVEGQCPAGTRTIRPPGRASCDVAARMAAQAAPVAPRPATPVRAATPHTDLAWIGHIERWLLPALAYAGIGVGLVVVLAVTWSERRVPPSLPPEHPSH